MLSIRSLARCASRLAPQFSQRSVSRQVPTFRTQVAALPLSRPSIATRFVAPFSSSVRTRQDDQTLVLKLQEEIQVEQDIKDPEGSSSAIQDFLTKTEFKVQDIPGEEEVVLTRDYNGETIRVTFSIADIANSDLVPEASDDAFPDEEEAPTLTNQTRGNPRNTRSTSEDGLEQEIDEEDEVPDAAFPARINVTITKQGKAGAMMVEAVAQDGEMLIENMYFFEDASHADPKTFEQEWKRRGVYAGPPFGNLDEELQNLLDRHLAERGINDELAVFVPDYIDYKEQKEYLRWLNNLKTFHE